MHEDADADDDQDDWKTDQEVTEEYRPTGVHRGAVFAHAWNLLRGLSHSCRNGAT
jgi:hypothetical protein